jgi:hypothetical protein
MKPKSCVSLAAPTGRSGSFEATAWLNRHASGDQSTDEAVDAFSLFEMRHLDARRDGRACARKTLSNTDTQNGVGWAVPTGGFEGLRELEFCAPARGADTGVLASRA